MNWSLVTYTAKANLLNQISQTYLGWVWWVLEPILTMAVYYFVFEYLLQRGGPGYVYLLLVGIATWTWFGNSVANASTSILREKGIISTISINKAVFPSISVIETGFKSALVLSILLVFLALSLGPQGSWLYLPALILELLLLVAAVSICAAALMPFFPDLNFLINIALRAAMFCSGVFFTVDMLPEEIRGYFLLNPMANIIEQFRQVLIYGNSPDWQAIAVISCLSAVFLTLGFLLVNRYDKLYARLVIQ